MEIIVISSAQTIDNEASLIVAAIEAGASRIHIRKPDWSYTRTKELVESIPSSFRDKLTLHDHFELGAELGVGGIQINGRNPIAPAGFKGLVSRSCHSLEELEANNTEFDYQTISPIFNSISKQGYQANFSQQQLKEACANKIINHKTIALAGITPEHIPYLSKLGFGGVALMGYVWQDTTAEGVSARVAKAVKMARMCSCFALQLITHRNEKTDDLELSKLALEGGCKWVQLRMKGFSDNDFMAVGAELKTECQKHDAIFLLNDRAHLVEQCGADGVHLGKNDIAPSQAREMLGHKAIIGGTANTCEDIDYLVAQGVDYIGLGPFRFTSTKDNLSPVLGLDGYKAAINHCKKQNYSVPIVAIGGITVEDINEIMKCGVSGIALSGTILNAPSSTQTTNEIMKILR